MAKQYKKGDRVAVLNSTPSGKVFVEATDATVIRHNFDNWYDVRIRRNDSGGSDVVERHVDSAAQADPHAFAAELNARLAGGSK